MSKQSIPVLTLTKTLTGTVSQHRFVGLDGAVTSADAAALGVARTGGAAAAACRCCGWWRAPRSSRRGRRPRTPRSCASPRHRRRCRHGRPAVARHHYPGAGDRQARARAARQSVQRLSGHHDRRCRDGPGALEPHRGAVAGAVGAHLKRYRRHHRGFPARLDAVQHQFKVRFGSGSSGMLPWVRQFCGGAIWHGGRSRARTSRGSPSSSGRASGGGGLLPFALPLRRPASSTSTSGCRDRVCGGGRTNEKATARRHGGHARHCSVVLAARARRWHIKYNPCQPPSPSPSTTPRSAPP